ncbi:glycosyltransferase family 2 protein [Methylobacillus flagellatus]|uniref:glycosyltransferase family 2 protein n=1 Tax=Methylobacillus flagellatus TaxID=405 RepID=UPI0010F543BC|nr:glycosyltransferase family 2 protein [Methylobacillus flagellatus]
MTSPNVYPAQLSVVVPVRNEADNVADLIGEISLALEGLLEYEIIYVDDGSTDPTLLRLLAVRQQQPRLRIISHAASCGQSTAVRSGVKAARFDWVVTLDGDGQNDPADIPKLLAALAPGVELVGGNRRHSRKDTWIKRLSSRVANAVRSRMLNDETPDSGCGLKLFPRAVFLDLPYFDHMHRFLPALIKRHGGLVVSVPVGHRQREHGRSNYGTLDRLLVGIVDLFGVAWLQRRAKLPVATEKAS